MGLVRRFLSIFLLALALAGLIYGYVWFKTKNFILTEPYKAIPANAVAYLETSDFPQLASQLLNYNNIWKEFQCYEEIKMLDVQINEIDSMSRVFPEFRELLKSPLIISLNRIEDKFELLFILSSGKNKATEQVLKLLNNEAGIDKRRFSGQVVYDLQFKSKRIPSKLSFFESSGLFILSTSPQLLDEAVKTLHSSNSKIPDEKFVRLRETRGRNVMANVYVNYPGLGNFLDEKMFPGSSSVLNNFAEWSAFDLDVKPNHLTLNGFTNTSDSLKQQLTLLSDQEPSEFSMISVIPASAVYFRVAGFSNAVALLSGISSYPQTEELRKKKEDLSKNYPGDFMKDFAALLSGEAGEITVKMNKGFEKYFVCSLRAASITEIMLSEWIKNTAEAGGGQYSAFHKEMLIDNRNSATVYKSPVSGFPEVFFAGLFSNQDFRYFGFVDNYLVFGDSYESVKDYIYQNSLGKTLVNDEYFNSLRNNFASKSNLFIYLNPSVYFEEIVKLLNHRSAEEVRKANQQWKKINAVSFQSTSSDDLNYFHVFLNFPGEVREIVNTVWQRKLDTVSVMKPAIVINHLTNEKEIFIQDLHNNIYLSNNSGSILWKQKIEGRILGDLLQIDYFKNGKLQYLFNTATKIHLIDRNGNPVERFPVALRETASAGLSVFDYDHDGSLRICVPCENGNIYMYDREGKVISGWNFKKADHPISHPVQHVRIGDKDFIIANDRLKLHVLDRKGQERLKYTQQIEFSPNNPVYILNQRKTGSYLSSSDINGSVYNFYFDGTVKKVVDNKLSAGHFYVPSDLNGDGKMEYIFTDKKRLMVYSGSGTLQFSEELPVEIDKKPVIYEFSAVDKKIGIVADQSDKIYLFNAKGSLYQGFPLRGTTLFSISSFPGLNARFNLIVGNNDNFLYNYSVK